MSADKNEGEEPKENKNSLVPKLPKLPSVEIPPVQTQPNVRLQVKQGIEKLLPNLTNEELHYATQVIANIAQQRLAQKQPSEPVDPILQGVLDDIALAEQYLTQGYNVEYPPKRVIPLGEQPSENDVFDLILERLDPLLKSDKVQDQLARILGALADKLEGKK